MTRTARGSGPATTIPASKMLCELLHAIRRHRRVLVAEKHLLHRLGQDAQGGVEGACQSRVQALLQMTTRSGCSQWLA